MKSISPNILQLSVVLLMIFDIKDGLSQGILPPPAKQSCPSAHGRGRPSGFYLVTLGRSDLATVIQCVAFTRDRDVQNKFDSTCIPKLPVINLSALNVCRQRLIGPGNIHDAFVQQPDLAYQVIDCINIFSMAASDYTEQERNEQVAFEYCAREIYTDHVNQCVGGGEWNYK